MQDLDEDIDGIDMWDVLNNDGPNRRQQLLHNIDDVWNVWALRDGNYKLVSGTTHDGQFDNWFLPPGEANQTNQVNMMKSDYESCIAHKVLTEMNYSVKAVRPVIVVCDPSKRSDCKPTEKPCLFDIGSDPCEYNNMFDQKPQIVDSMIKLLAKYNSTAVEPIVRSIDPKSDPVLHHYWWDVWQ